MKKVNSLLFSNFRLLFLTILFVICFITSAWATTYYVDSSRPDDSGNGQSPTTAWKTLTKVNSVSFAPGDSILLIKGGVFRGQIKPISSGSSSQPITYGTYGSGAAPIVINGKSFPAGTAWSGPNSNGEYSLNIGSTPSEFGALRGQPAGVNTYKRVILGFGSGSLTPDTYAFNSGVVYYKPLAGHNPSEYDWEFATYSDGTVVFNSNISNIVVDGIVFMNSGYSGTNYGLVNFLGKNCTVQNCSLLFGYNFNAMFSGSACQYNTLKNCKILYSKGSGVHLLNNNSHNTVTGCEIAYCSVNSTSVESCGVDRAPICSLPCSYNTITYNYLHDNGCSDTTRYYAEIHCDGGDNWNMSWNKIINAPFKGMACTITDGTAPAHHNHFDYNLIWNCDRYGSGYDKNIGIMIFTTGSSSSSTAGNDTANNNTIINDQNRPMVGISFANYSNGGYGPNMQAKNNIIYSTYQNSDSQGIRFRQGINYYPGSEIGFNCTFGPTPYTISDSPVTQTSIGASNDINADPQFVGASDFHLKPTSPCINNGTDFGQQDDIEHNPIIGIPDRGAFEYQSNPPTDPPSLAPVASFNASVTSGQAPLTINFTDTSTNSPTSWAWNFGDGATSNSQNPIHTYNTAGTYTVKLTASNSVGSNSASKTITVTAAPAAPVANFSANPTSGQAPLPVNFTDNSTGSPTSRSWNFGDGSASSSQNPSHTYNAAGTYTVTLTVSNSAGSNSASKTVTVTAAPAPAPAPVVAAPVANFSANPTSGQAPLPVNFSDSSTGSPTSWAWNFGDGSASSSQNPSHTYNTAGTYTVTLTVSNSGGSNSTSKTVSVTAAPAPAPTPNPTSSPVTSISPTYKSFSSSGGKSSITANVTSQTGWAASSNASWITVTSVRKATFRRDRITYSVDRNSTGTGRSGSLSIGDKTFTVSQAAGATSTASSNSGRATSSKTSLASLLKGWR